MYPPGPCKSYIWPKPQDVCWISIEYVLQNVSVPKTPTGRTYQISCQENQSIEKIFQNFQK